MFDIYIDMLLLKWLIPITGLLLMYAVYRMFRDNCSDDDFDDRDDKRR